MLEGLRAPREVLGPRTRPSECYRISTRRLYPDLVWAGAGSGTLGVAHCVLSELMAYLLKGSEHLLVHGLVVIQQVVVALLPGVGLAALRAEVIVDLPCRLWHRAAALHGDL